MTIRPATAADADALRALSIDTFSRTFGHLYDPADLSAYLEQAYSPEALGALLADPAYRFWLCFEDDSPREGCGAGAEPIGYALAGPCSLPHEAVRPGDGEVKRLYMRHDRQGGGRGEALMRTALQWLDERGAPAVWLGVWSGNAGAQRFYDRFGFAKVGEYDFVVGEQRDREFIMRRPALP